jgi:PAS fold
MANDMANSHNRPQEVISDAPRGRARWPRVGRFSSTAEDRWEWSDTLAEMHGFEPGTVRSTIELILSHKNPDDKPGVAHLIEQVRRHGVPFSSPHRIIDATGTIHLVVVVAERCFAAAGEITGTTGFYIDITDEYDTDVRRTLDEVVDEIESQRGHQSNDGHADARLRCVSGPGVRRIDVSLE